MKNFIKKTLNYVLGEALTRKLIKNFRYSFNHLTGRFARYGIDRTLAELLPHENGYYVELGANDGALASNSYFFELKRKWQGVLVEPVPSLFLECYARRGKKNKVFCNACVPFEFTNEFVRLQYMGAMTISKNLEKDLDISEFMKRGELNIGLDETVFEFGAISATLTFLLDRAGAPSIIDFLSLDVEGAELDVLKGIKFDKYTFKCIVIECRTPKKVEEYLKPFDYFIYRKLSHHDYLFCNKAYFS